MKATVDKDSCIGCGVCVQICDAVFEMDGDVARAKVEPVPAEAEAACREAAEACPVEAISIAE
ncbi:ferredoxin [Pontiella sulfatireligans]|uniref:Ferredoxin n=1 Tax=Pontiella sulfatireligans TaxID=2750658 RepID=A0A6C2UWB2_9BACT|nr:ferredoxin [Pontiella sulfatireligans]VGO23397.1 Ferredoxin [Pontiella sulfatireligans]